MAAPSLPRLVENSHFYSIPDDRPVASEKAALYAREASPDPSRVQTQLQRLRNDARQRGWEVWREYIDEPSAPDRPAWAFLMADARMGEFDLVMVRRFRVLSRLRKTSHRDPGRLAANGNRLCQPGGGGRHLGACRM